MVAARLERAGDDRNLRTLIQSQADEQERYGTTNPRRLAALRSKVPYGLGDLIIGAAESSLLPVAPPAMPTHRYQIGAGLVS